MKVKIFFLGALFFALTSCATLKERHIETAKKVLSSMQQGNGELIHSMIALNADKIGLDLEQIEFDCERLKKMENKYGIVDVSKMKYVVNPKDFVTPYMVEFPVFLGEDTIWNKRVKGISLRILFGPENVNSPNKIAYYEVYFDRI
jgi:hypothetical protein